MRADELGWQGLDNGAMLDAAELAGFDLLLTCDQTVPYQQNFTGRRPAALRPMTSEAKGSIAGYASTWISGFNSSVLRTRYLCARSKSISDRLLLPAGSLFMVDNPVCE